jgi:hypothetical protein
MIVTPGERRNPGRKSIIKRGETSGFHDIYIENQTVGDNLTAEYEAFRN